MFAHLLKTHHETAAGHSCFSPQVAVVRRLLVESALPLSQRLSGERLFGRAAFVLNFPEGSPISLARTHIQSLCPRLEAFAL